MRPPPSPREWLKPSEFAAWVRTAVDTDTHQQRLAIALVVCERLHVPAVARMLFVSPRSVSRWLETYDADGPAALGVQPRGGRRDAHLTHAAEAALLATFHDRALRGEIVTATTLQHAIEQVVGHAVSTSYLWDLLHRHAWRKLAPRPHHPKADPARQARFKKFSPPHGNRAETDAGGPASAPALRR